MLLFDASPLFIYSQVFIAALDERLILNDVHKINKRQILQQKMIITFCSVHYVLTMSVLSNRNNQFYKDFQIFKIFYTMVQTQHVFIDFICIFIASLVVFYISFIFRLILEYISICDESGIRWKVLPSTSFSYKAGRNLQGRKWH